MILFDFLCFVVVAVILITRRIRGVPWEGGGRLHDFPRSHRWR